MKVYPHRSPIILNDTIFNLYGGENGSFNGAQRNAAYLIAEQQASSYIGTLLLPTVVTGTWGYSSRIVTDYGYVHQIFSTNLLTVNNVSTPVLVSNTGYAFIKQDTFGYLDVTGILGYCGCFTGIPYQVQVAYEAGLPTGVATQPPVLLALTMAAQNALNEMTFPSMNEGTGDIGIQSFSSLDYSERRVAMRRTAFGTSARAEKMASLIDGAVQKARPYLGL